MAEDFRLWIKQWMNFDLMMKYWRWFMKCIKQENIQQGEKKMKIRIKSGDCPSYLTVGKVYEVLEKESETYVWIIDDSGEDLAVFLPCCAHINDASWEIVND